MGWRPVAAVAKRMPPGLFTQKWPGEILQVGSLTVKIQFESGWVIEI
jgi:hypothetical protein